MAFVPEERLGRGAVPSHTLWENAVLTAHRFGLVRSGLVDRQGGARSPSDVIDKFKVKANGPQSKRKACPAAICRNSSSDARSRSSRNCCSCRSRPGASMSAPPRSSARHCVDLSRAGAAVLVVSEELDELFEICDRLLVICKRRVSPSLVRTATDREEIGLLMTGLNGSDGAASGEWRSCVSGLNNGRSRPP